MAGVKISIQVQDNGVNEQLATLVALGRDLSLPMADAGEYLLRSTRDRAALQIDPDGVAWVPLSPKYAKRKAKLRPGAPILKFDYHLLGDQLVYQTGPNFVEVGTGSVYGATEQFGRDHIPARPFLGLSAEDRVELIDIFAAYISG